MAFASPSATNVFVPPSIARELTIDYARNPADFPLNRYCQRKPVQKVKGNYLRINPDQNARVLYSDLRDKRWPDRAPRPSRPDNTPLFEFVPYATERFSEDYTIGYRERNQADFDLTKAHSRMAIQQTMTDIATFVLTELANASFGENTSTANDLVNGYLDTGTASNPVLFNALLKARIAIEKATVGMIRGDDLLILMSPEAARKLALSNELFAIRAESTLALPLITGRGNAANTFGLPTQIYGHDYVVENSVRVTSRKGASTSAKDYILGEDDIYLVSRPGGIEATDGTTAKSTITIFHYTGDKPDGTEGKDYDGSEFSIEQYDDPENRMMRGHVTWDIDPQVTTTLSAYKFTECFEPASS